MFDQSPQDYLDDLHLLNIPALFKPELTQRNRLQKIQTGRQQVQNIQSDLKKVLRSLHRTDKNDSRIPAYHLLESLSGELLTAIADLEKRTKAGQILPQPVYFGSVILGDEESGDWFLGEPEDERLWLDMKQIKDRLERMMAQRAPLHTRLTEIKDQLSVLQVQQKRDLPRYKKLSGSRFLLRQRLIFLTLAVLSIGAGVYIVFSQNDQTGLLAFVPGSLFIILIPVTRRFHKRRIDMLRKQLRERKQTIKTLKQEGQKIKRQYYPIDEMCRDLKIEYDELRQIIRQ